MRKSRNPPPIPRRSEWRPLLTLIQGSATGPPPALLPYPRRRPSGGHPHGNACPDYPGNRQNTPPHPRAVAPFCLKPTPGYLYHYPRSTRANFHPGPSRPNVFSKPPSNPAGYTPLLAPLGHLAAGTMIILPEVHDWGPKSNAVLIKGCSRRWELNRKRRREWKLNREGRRARRGNRARETRDAPRARKPEVSCGGSALGAS